MRRTTVLRLAISAFASASAVPAFATPFTTLQTVTANYNVFLLGNLGSSGSAYGADSIGAVAVAGNAFATGASFDSGGYGANALIVGGNLTQSGGTDTGSVYVGGTGNFTNGATVLSSANGVGSLTDKGASLTVTGGSTPPGGITVSNTTSANVPAYMSGAVTHSGSIAPPLDLFGTSTDLTNASTSLGTLNATHVASSGGAITLTLTQNGLNIIDLSVTNGATINGITINAAPGVSATGLIVNVAGNNLIFNGGTFSLGLLNQHNVLFNFTNATNLNLTSLAFEGSLLAPLADVNFVNGDIEGALIANNFTGGGEFHELAFTTALPAFPGQTATPEPASLGLFAVGIAAMSLIRRRGPLKRTLTAVAIAIAMPSALVRPAAADTPPTAASSGAAMPQMEHDYIAIVLDARRQYQAARTIEARKGVRAGMQIRLHQLFGLYHDAGGWTGTIRNVQTLPGGARAVWIELGPNISVSTWQNRFFDGEHATLILPPSPFYHALDDANAGTPVRFSATLIGSRVESDDEMVLRPELIARFTTLKQLE